MNAPCKDCPARTPGCHSHCDKYAAFHADNERRKAICRTEKDARDAEAEGKLRVWQEYQRGRMTFGHRKTVK